VQKNAVCEAATLSEVKQVLQTSKTVVWKLLVEYGPIDFSFNEKPFPSLCSHQKKRPEHITEYL